MRRTRLGRDVGDDVRVQRLGLTVDVPAGWDLRIFRRPAADAATTNPVLHLANFRLPENRGDFGGGAVERMGPENILVVLFEYDEQAASTPLFARRGRPVPSAADFSPRQLQRTLPGQSGVQYFYSDAGRAFCLYVVLGSHARRAALVSTVRGLLQGLAVGPRARHGEAPVRRGSG